MTKQKLVRKYRLLRKHEKIRWNDIVIANGEQLDDNLVHSTSRVQDLSITYIGSTPAQSCQDSFVRFVDCVPAPSTTTEKGE